MVETSPIAATATVLVSEGNCTLLAFARRRFRPPLASARHVARCLDLNLFHVNGYPSPAHTRRLRPGDTVELCASLPQLSTARFAAPPLRLLAAAPGRYAVWAKPPGMPRRGSAADALAAALPQAAAALPGGPAPLLDCVACAGRAIGGPALVAFAPDVAARLRDDLRAGRFRFTFHVIVHGEPPLAFLESKEFVDSAGVLSVDQIAVTNSTVGPLTSLRLVLSGDDTGVRRTLNDAGFPVLGNGAMAKPSKTASHGMFMWCMRLLFPDPLEPLASGKVADVIIDLPEKFAAILARERRCFEEKEARLRAATALRSSMSEEFVGLCTKKGVWPQLCSRATSEQFAAFCKRPFFVSEAVMRPRASSELLVRSAMSLMTPHWTRLLSMGNAGLSRPVRILDLGVGSGALLLGAMLSLKDSYQHLDVTGVGIDISADALAVARCNTVVHGLTDSVHLALGDFRNVASILESDCDPQCDGFDLLFCNPPYLTSDERKHEHDFVQGPDVALLSDDCKDKRLTSLQSKGLASYEALAIGIGACPPTLLRPGGRVIVELGGKRSQSGVELLLAIHTTLRLEIALDDEHGFTRCLVFTVQLPSTKTSP